MRRLFRIIIRSLTVLSLLPLLPLLCVATCAMWGFGLSAPVERLWNFHGVHWRAVAGRAAFQIDNSPQIEFERVTWRVGFLKRSDAFASRMEHVEQERDDALAKFTGRLTQEDERREEEIEQRYMAGRFKTCEEEAASHELAKLNQKVTKRVAFQIAPQTLIVMTAAMPLWSSILWIARRVRVERPQFACRSCGYDLRATPDRCPECGTAAPTKAVT